MPWFRLDDKGAFHAKVLAAGNEAYGAWCRAGQWCSERLTDGLIPMTTALTIGPKKLWERLVRAGLVERRDDGDLQIHDYLVYNPSAAEVRSERDRKQKNIRDYRDRRNRGSGVHETAPVTDIVTGYETGDSAGGINGPDPDPREIPQTPKREPIREICRRAYSEGATAALGAKAFAVLDSEAEVIVQVVRDSPPWAGLRGETLATAIRNSVVAYVTERRDDGKFERGFAPTKWAEWLRGGGGAPRKPNGPDLATLRTNQVQEELMRKAMAR